MGTSFYLGIFTLATGMLLGAQAPIAAAQEPTLPGDTGTVALQGTVDEEYKAANVIIVKTADGVRHAFHFTKDLLVHGGRSSGPDALHDLHEGTTVVVHYSAAGDIESAEEIDRIDAAGLAQTEGVITHIDRGKKEITIRVDDGKSETLRLTDRAAANVGKDIERTSAPARVTLYYSDEAGDRVVHFFTPVTPVH